MDFVSARKDKIKFFCDVHSFSQFILVPWGYTKEKAPGHDDLYEMAALVRFLLAYRQDLAAISCFRPTKHSIKFTRRTTRSDVCPACSIMHMVAPSTGVSELLE